MFQLRSHISTVVLTDAHLFLLMRGLAYPEEKCRHNPDAKQEKHKLAERGREMHFPMELRQKIGTRDEEEIPCRERKENELDVGNNILEEENEDHAEECRARREEIVEECTALRESAVDEDGKIADLLRDFVQDDGHCRCDPEVRTCKVCTSDHDAIHHVMDPIPNQHHRANRMRVIRAIDRMAVVPVDEFFDDEGEHDSRKDKGKRDDRIRSLLHNFRQELEEDVREERSRCKCDEGEEKLS